MIMLTDSLNDALTVNAKVDQGSAVPSDFCSERLSDDPHLSKSS